MKISWQPFTAAPRKKLIQSEPQLMTTFRKGDKYLKSDLIGEKVEFVDETDGSIFATGRIVSVKACRFGDIDPSDHARQSSEMTPDNRLLVMQRAYKDPTYGYDTLTTVVTIGDVVSRITATVFGEQAGNGPAQPE